MTQRTSKFQNYLVDKSFLLNFSSHTSYNEAKNLIKCFDIIAFDHQHLIMDVQELSKDFNISLYQFSHYGLVIDHNVIKSLKINGENISIKEDKLYVLYFSFDIISISEDMEIKYRDKVNLTLLDELVQSNILYWCKLINYPSKELNLDFLFTEKTCDPIYFYANLIPNLSSNERLLEIVFNLIENFKFSHVPNQRSLQIIGKIYQDLDILPNSLNLKDILPIDFFGSYEDGLQGIVSSVFCLQI